MTDEYAESGEFLDVLSGDAWAVQREPVAAALAGVDPAAGPLVDLGADRIAPGAPLVLNVQPPARAEAVPESDFVSVSIGGYRYVGGGRAEPDGPDAVVWHMRYRVCDEGGSVERELTAAYRWHIVNPGLIEAELTAVGLAVQHGPHGLVRAGREDRW